MTLYNIDFLLLKLWEKLHGHGSIYLVLVRAANELQGTLQIIGLGIRSPSRDTWFESGTGPWSSFEAPP